MIRFNCHVSTHLCMCSVWEIYSKRLELVRQLCHDVLRAWRHRVTIIFQRSGSSRSRFDLRGSCAVRVSFCLELFLSGSLSRGDRETYRDLVLTVCSVYFAFQSSLLLMRLLKEIFPKV